MWADRSSQQNEKKKKTKTHANWRNGIQVTKKDYAVNILQRSKNALILILTPLILIQLALSPQKVETFEVLSHHIITRQG